MLAVYARVSDQGEVALALSVSVQTVKNHLSASYRKLGAHSQIEAFRLLGWLVPPDLADAQAVRRVSAFRRELQLTVATARELTTIMERLSQKEV